MKKILFIFIFLSANNAFCSIDTLLTSSKITQVTVFFSGAQVTRKADIKASKGKHLLILDKLPEEINPQSIQVNGIDNCKILSVKHQLIYPTENKKGKSETDIENTISLQEMKIKEIKNKFNVFDIEEKLLLDNSLLRKKDEGSAISDIKEAADFYRLRLNEIRQGKLKLSEELETATKKIQELYEQLNELASKRRKTYSQILITVDCEKDINADMSLSYYISSAAWSPTYDFRVDDITKPLNIVYNALVYQSSGENWNNVSLKLSTNNPSLSGKKPELDIWYLGRYTYQNEPLKQGSGTLKGRVLDVETNEPLPFATVIVEQNNVSVSGTTTDMDGQFNIKPIQSGTYNIKATYIGYNQTQINGILVYPDKITFQDMKLQPSTITLEEVQIVEYKKPLIQKDKVRKEEISKMPELSVNSIQARGATSQFGDFYYVDGVKTSGIETSNYISNSLKTNVTNLEYTIDIPYSIPSDGLDYNIKIKEVSLPVNYMYHAVPKLDNDVFLTAEVSDWEQLNLLSGKSSIYYQGTYTGESFIDAVQTADTLKISLGRDRNIIVQRESNKEMFDKRLIGSNIKETIGWNITVKNNKNTKIRISIEDQFPVSEKKSIEVERLEYSSAKLTDKTGKLTWEFELNPTEKKTLNYKYSVKYPKETNLTLE